MLPGLVVTDFSGCADADTKVGSKTFEAPLPPCTQIAHLSYLLVRQLRISLLLATRNLFRMEMCPVSFPTGNTLRMGMCAITAFSYHIHRVIRGHAEAEMIRPDTLRIIATVAYEQTRHDQAKGKFIRKSVCQGLASIIRILSRNPGV